MPFEGSQWQNELVNTPLQDNKYQIYELKLDRESNNWPWIHLPCGASQSGVDIYLFTVNNEGLQ